ncbi:hypothetical protein MNEG_15024 [Monoraphidium neglectum]|uniref:Uncharacterized protein n=1 Tax=Monoraphidium neglectum TaxID=145388 RepID=A0A0D2LM99_9CHLO|nr:hypothetical protein MNEG_15024 [Monoraphidium neglectum]KIY92939.1 hypothetical protein MNEG_15024 [Monoraphidium neglectum]|eukprot:XP_013891959.1 hypothetical protein MNEG_15024 [Monoraphidium neglectum]
MQQPQQPAAPQQAQQQQQPQAPPQQQPQQAQQAVKMSAMEQLNQYKLQLETDLVRVEAQIADMELKFFQADHSAVASVVKTRAVPRPQQQQPHLHAHAHAPGLGARPALPLENAHQDTRAAAGRATHGACPIPWCTSFRQPNRCAASALAQGFEAHLSSKEALRKRALRSWKPEDRWFSLSSTSSPVAQELAEQEAAEPALQGGFGKKGYPPAKGAYPQKGKR